MVIETIEGNWSKTPITGSAYQVSTIGINAVTIHDSTPYFFLFSDIDTKEREQLREVLKVYRNRNLSCYFYETTKGWHVISTVLLKLRKWISLCNLLRPIVPDYSFDTIRYSMRSSDGKMLYFEDWNHKELESYDLHYYILQKFNCDLKHFQNHYVSSKIDWTIYNQLRLKKIRHR